MSPLRCPYCHEGLAAEPALTCSGCETPCHVACWAEHGGCSVFGCAHEPVVEERASGPMAWADFVREASPWLEVGVGLVWEPDAGAGVDVPAVLDVQSGSGSASRAA